MAEPLTGFRSDNGNIFDNEHAAWIDDLDHWLSKSITNVGFRTSVRDAILADALNGNHLRQIIAQIEATKPPLVRMPIATP